MLTIEQRLSNLENLVNSLAKRIDGNKFYADADTQGNRQSISELTPYTETRQGYIGDTEITFNNVPSGNMSIFFTNYNGDYSTRRVNDRVTISFDALTEQTDITISIQ